MGGVRSAIDVRAVELRARSGIITLRDISITICHGELIAIIGGRRSGKEALLEVMGGVRIPSSGTINRRSENIGYVPTEDVLHPQLPLARALGYAASLRGLPAAAVEQSLATVELAGRADTVVAALALGERRRAALALALLGAPSLLFLDEPASGADPVEHARLMRLLRAFTDGGMTVVMTATHPPDAERCDKVAVLADGGHLAFFGTPEAARDYFGADSVEEIYERLAGAADPMTAWSRRYFRFPRTSQADWSPFFFSPARPERAPDPIADPDLRPVAGAYDEPGPRRQLAVLVARNADVLSRTRRLSLALLAGPPLTALVALSALFRAGPLHGTALLWLAFSGFFFGLAWGLPQVIAEQGIFRHERRPEPGAYGAGVYVLAKAAVLLPPLVIIDVLFLVLLDALGGRPGLSRFGPTYLTLLLCTTAALGAGLLISAVARAPYWAAIALPAAFFPLLLVSWGVASGHAGWPGWLILAVATAATFAAACRYLSRDT